jgi:hypothetical protein
MVRPVTNSSAILKELMAVRKVMRFSVEAPNILDTYSGMSSKEPTVLLYFRPCICSS